MFVRFSGVYSIYLQNPPPIVNNCRQAIIANISGRRRRRFSRDVSEEVEEETVTSWVLDTLGGVKEEMFDSLVNTGANTSWVDGIVSTLVNENEEEYNEIYSGDQEEEEDESCAIVTWRCLSQVMRRDNLSPFSSS